MPKDKSVLVPNGAEVYLIAGIVSGLSMAVIADTWHGFMVNLWAHRASYVFLFSGLAMFWAVVTRHWSVQDESNITEVAGYLAPQEKGNTVQDLYGDKRDSRRQGKVSCDRRV